METLKRRPLLVSGTLLAISSMAANVVNLLFNIFLGRAISLENFGIITLINSFMYFGSIFYNALLMTTNHQVSSFEGRDLSKNSDGFFIAITKQITIVNVILAVIWVIAVPFITNFFQIDQSIILYLLTPILIFYPLAALSKGYLQGKLLFLSTALIIFLEPIIKLISGFAFIFTDSSRVYLSIYISAVSTGILALLLVLSKKPSLVKDVSYKFPLTFFMGAILIGLSTISFLAIDMFLVKHYLSPVQAGEYAFLSLIGKIIYFLGSILNIFTITIVSREMAGKKRQFISFYWLFAGAAFLCSMGFLIFGVFGQLTIPLIFSSKATSIIPDIIPYISAITIFTLGNIIVSYHLAKKQYIFPIIALAMSAFITFGIFLYHKNITEIVYTLLTVGIVYSLILFVTHIRYAFVGSKIKVTTLKESIYG